MTDTVTRPSGASALRFLLTAILAAAPLPAAGQSVTLEGRVTDALGVPVAAAEIAAREVATGSRRSATTRSNGEFRMLGLSPGRYEVTVSAPGYATHTRIADLIVDQLVMLHVRLEPAVSELDPIVVHVDRTSATEIVRSSVSGAVLEQEIARLPLSTRNTMDLAGLVPGIRSFRPLGGNSMPAAGALRDLRFVNLYLDGVPLKSLYDGNLIGFPYLGSPLPASALKEFRVHLQPYDAAYTHGASYIISAVTHGGTNERQGSTFGLLQHRDFVSGNSFLEERPNFTAADFRRQQAGLTVRGPIVRDRLFYATTYELSNTTNYVTVVPPRPANDPGVWDQYAGVFPAPTRNHTGLLRLTYAAPGSHTVDIIGSVRRLTTQTLFGGPVTRESAALDRHTVGTLNVRHRWLASPHFVNELGVQLIGWWNAGHALFPQPALFYPGLQIGAPAPEFELEERHVRLVERVTIAANDALGDHQLDAGIELTRSGIENFFPIFGLGRFDFAPGSTLPIRGAIAVGATQPDSDRDALVSLDGWLVGAWIAHQWQPHPSLKVNLGVRYDAELGLLNQKLRLPWAADPELAAMPQLQPYLNQGDRSTDLDNVSPRASLSWDLRGDGRTAIRGGFGIMHDRIPALIAFQERRTATWPTYSFADPGTTDPDELRRRVLSGDGQVTELTLIANDMETPQSRQWSIGVGHRITPTIALNLDFVHQDVHNLYAQLNLNWRDQSASPPRRALSESYGDISVWDDFARARYRALLAQFTWHPADDRRISIAYTLGDARADWDGANQNVPASVADRFYVLQRTSGDERHRVVVSGFVPLPLDIQLSAIGTVASPRPYQARVGMDVNSNGVIFDDWLDERRYRLPANRWRNWYRVVDLRLARQLPLGARADLTLMAEAFNLLNTVNYSSFDGNLHTAAGENLNFGRPNGVFGTRQLQLGARLDF